MRIAIASWSRRKIGGVETYLDGVIPELSRVGHELSFLHESDDAAGRERITLPGNAQAWCVSDTGAEDALAGLRDWRPDLIYAHGFHDTRLEAKVGAIAPVVFFAHGYYGTCISGSKAVRRPDVMPCSRRFGWQCLVRYYPHRCGGLNPRTMLRLYRDNLKKLEHVKGFSAVVTHSEHMRSEYIKHGVTPDKVHNIPFPVAQVGSGSQTARDSGGECETDNARAFNPELNRVGNLKLPAGPYRRLLFLGRMDFLKGGRVFLEALPQVSACLGQPLWVTFAGDGPDERAWRQKAERVRADNEKIHIEFVGWRQGRQLEPLLKDCDLLVMPSVWPEPFGLAGPEAGLWGVPAVAFVVGGVPTWLADGVNGHLAPGNPPTAGGLAQAIIKCLGDPRAHARLRHGAVRMARRLTMNKHLSALLPIFEAAVRCEGAVFNNRACDL
jgi:glycosyltransferase involved in cell wall biosynthesis